MRIVQPCLEVGGSLEGSDLPLTVTLCIYVSNCLERAFAVRWMTGITTEQQNEMIDLKNLEGVAETLIVPLLGRALETLKPDGILHDEKALSIIENLDFDQSKFNDPLIQRSFLRTTVRTAIIDKLLDEFLTDHPEATVVEIGCGLNSRFERLDNGSVTWFDLDLPAVHDVWKSFFNETERRQFLPYSAFDTDWMDRVKAGSAAPWFFISEASVIYFSEAMVRSLFENMKSRFHDIHYLFDSATPSFIEGLKGSGDAIKLFNVTLGWGVEDISEIKSWIPGMEIIESVNLEDRQHRFGALYPADFIGNEVGYQLNLVRF